MPEIPEYVGYANDLVEKVGARLEQTLKDTVAEMATKSDLALVEERAKYEVADLRAEIAELHGKNTGLRAEIKSDKDEAVAKGRRIWRAIWTVFGGVAVALLPNLFSLITTHQ